MSTYLDKPLRTRGEVVRVVRALASEDRAGALAYALRKAVSRG